MKNVSSIDKSDCCGCTACYSICALHAIRMQKDEQGFMYPSIDLEKCVNCGQCLRVCSGIHSHYLLPLKCFGVKHKNKQEQLSSTSGGFSAALSQNVIEQGGIVYGVVYENVKNVVTCRIDDKKDLHLLKGSKYVQTDPKETFKEVYVDLLDNKKVAYFGTSCHIDGLLNYLAIKKIDTKNLITIDLICHGVPSPQLFEEYIDYLSRRKPVSKFYFRTKAEGWGLGSKTYSPSVRYTDGEKVFSTPRTLAFQQLFFSNNCLRPHCYQCPYAGKGRVGDFTIADFWGLNFLHPEKFDSNGVSLVLVNTQKGYDVFSSLSNIDSFETTYENACLKQGNQHSPSSKASTYDSFWKDYEQYGIEGILKKYTILNPKSYIKFYARQILAKFLPRYR